MLLVGGIGLAVANAIGVVDEITICGGTPIGKDWFDSKDPDMSIQGGVYPHLSASKTEASALVKSNDVVQPLPPFGATEINLRTCVLQEEYPIAGNKFTIVVSNQATNIRFMYMSDKMFNYRVHGATPPSTVINTEFEHAKRLQIPYSPTTSYGNGVVSHDFFNSADVDADFVCYYVDLPSLTKDDGTALIPSHFHVYRDPNSSFFYNDGSSLLLASKGDGANTSILGYGYVVFQVDLAEPYNVLSFIESSVRITKLPYTLTFKINSSANRNYASKILYDPKAKKLAFTRNEYYGYHSTYTTEFTRVFNFDINLDDFATFDWTTPVEEYAHNNNPNFMYPLAYCPNLYIRYSKNGKFIYRSDLASDNFPNSDVIPQVMVNRIVELQIPFDIRSRLPYDIPKAEEVLSKPYAPKSISGSQYRFTTGMFPLNMLQGYLLFTVSTSIYGTHVVKGRNFYQSFPNTLMTLSGEFLGEDRTCYAQNSQTEADTIEIIMRGSTLAKIADTAGTMTHFIVRFYGSAGVTYGIGTIGVTGSGADMEFPSTALAVNDVLEIPEIKFKMPLTQLFAPNNTPLEANIP